MTRRRAARTQPFLLDPERDSNLGPNIRARFTLEGRRVSRKALPEFLHTRLKKALEQEGFGRLYSHQVEGLEALHAGRDVLVSTPTASGKSLIYQLYALDQWLKSPGATAMFLYPMKALAQDQRGKINELAARLGFPEFRAEIYDGDTPPATRRKLMKSPPPVLLSNPDMFHLSFLAYHENWRAFFKRLSLFVLDEAHVYRGVFGVNVHYVFWRFSRILENLGAEPSWVATSATLSGGDVFYRALTGRDAVHLDRSGAPQPERRLFLLSSSGSPYTLACELMDRLLAEDARTLTFTKARRITELIFSWLCQRDASYRKTVSSYRAGFLPSERRRIEHGFFEGSLKGVVSTSAMEVGIDVGGLDACILVGYPGSLISLHQRMGRVGRHGNEADIFLIAMPDAMDQYFVQHPEALLDRPLEEIILDPDNRLIMQPHLLCAAHEAPLDDEEIPPEGAMRDALNILDAKGELVLDAEGTTWHTLRKRPHRRVNLRTMGEGFTIVNAAGKGIGSVDGVRVYRECHEGAIYLHQGQTYVVTQVAPKDRKVIVRPVRTDYYTEVRGDKDTEILEVLGRKRSGAYDLYLGRLKVTEYTTSYVKKRMAGGETIGEYDLDAPPVIFETEGFWFALPPAIAPYLSEEGLHVMGGIHALEHSMIGMFPLTAMADRWDLGGISYPHHPQVKGPAIFIYDGCPGGAGMSRKGFNRFEFLLESTARLLHDCPCEDGCPGCVQSPKCGNGNRPLDKAAAILLTEILEGKIPLRSRPKPLEIKPRISEKEPGPKKDRPKPGRLVFDLETQKLASEVGGWGNISKLGLALAVTWDLDREVWQTFYEEDAADLVDDLLNAELVIGFNVDRFDLEVMRPYTDRSLAEVKTLDMLAVLKDRLGFRLSLASLAEANFNEEKMADGVQSVQWFREGKLDLVAQYCRKDVELTGRLYLKGLEEGFLLFKRRGGGLLRVKINHWKP
jgi:DEAD/DEAH box helicase domain-containing protein